jgi:hypothetical protein
MKRRRRDRLGAVRCGGVAMSAKGEVTPRRGKGRDNANWGDTNLIGHKNEENSRGRFSYYK